jgi:hypothetical protein
MLAVDRHVVAATTHDHQRVVWYMYVVHMQICVCMAGALATLSKYEYCNAKERIVAAANFGAFRIEQPHRVSSKLPSRYL